MNKPASQIDINLDIDAITRVAYEAAMKAARENITGQANRYFADGRYGGAKGPGYMRIEAKMTELLHSEETEQRIQGMIDAAWPKALEEAIQKRIYRSAQRAAATKGKMPA